jgi:hypothetical protein
MSKPVMTYLLYLHTDTARELADAAIEPYEPGDGGGALGSNWQVGEYPDRASAEKARDEHLAAARADGWSIGHWTNHTF